MCRGRRVRTRGPDLFCRVYLRRSDFRQSFAVEGSVEVVVIQFGKWEGLSKTGVASELTRERQFGRLGQGRCGTMTVAVR